MSTTAAGTRSGRPQVVVVGGGTAGLFVAWALQEAADVTVVEAGPDPGTPPPTWLLYDYAFPAALDWGYREAETGAVLLRGRLTGGSSSVNSSAAVRGQPWCFDGWGSPRWTWGACLPAFRAVEADQEFGTEDYHGETGPIPVTRLAPGPVDEAVFDACRMLGHPWVDDHNRPGALGVGIWPTNRVAGGRWGTHAGVLPLLRDRVALRTGTVARRVAFSGTRCVGVDVADEATGRAERLDADLVVLSAGAYGTPELLVASGIGPERAVAGTPVVVADGVGQNLMDHPWCLLDVRATDPALPAARPVSGSLLRWELGGGPHVEAQMFPWQTHPYVGTAPATQISFTAALMAPESRGWLRFVPGCSRAQVHLRHLSAPADAARMAEIVALTAEVVGRLAAAGLVTPPRDPWWHTGDLVAACAARAATYNHPVGTCRMGPADDPLAVVGDDLMVHGVDGLAVVDASVMPRIPRAGTNLATMMIGRKAGAMLLERLDR